MSLEVTCALCPVGENRWSFADEEEFERHMRDHKPDSVNHPSHYTAYRGLEVIDLTEQMNFNRGNAVKYIARAGLKDPSKEIEDLEKANWYVTREIERLKKEKSDGVQR